MKPLTFEALGIIVFLTIKTGSSYWDIRCVQYKLL